MGCFYIHIYTQSFAYAYHSAEVLPTNFVTIATWRQWYSSSA